MRLAVALAVGGAIAAAVACGTDAVGVESCRQIEEARCRKAPACPDISLAQPLHPDKNDVNACIRYYDDACQHGLVAADPGGPAVNKCVDAINAGDCTIVEHPENADACKWLIPPAPAPPADAAADAAIDAPEAATD